MGPLQPHVMLSPSGSHSTFLGVHFELEGQPAPGTQSHAPCGAGRLAVYNPVPARDSLVVIKDSVTAADSADSCSRGRTESPYLSSVGRTKQLCAGYLQPNLTARSLERYVCNVRNSLLVLPP